MSDWGGISEGHCEEARLQADETIQIRHRCSDLDRHGPPGRADLAMTALIEG